jgi:1-deoxy-D-xylulose-5-phosphate reductoisomerase
MEKGGNLACALNAANEITVQAFLNDKITFLQITTIVEKVVAKSHFISNPTLLQLIETDKEARARALEIVAK